MGKKGVQKSKKAKTKSKAAPVAASGKYSAHVVVQKHEGRDVRVYGDAQVGRDTLYKDTAGVFCCTEKFMKAVTQCMTKFYKRHDFHNFGHICVSLDGKGALPIKRKGNNMQMHRSKLLSGQAYIFETKHREDFLNLVHLGDPLCLLRLEAFVGEETACSGRGYAGAKVWEEETAVAEKTEAEKASSKKTKREKKADRRAKKKMQLKAQQEKIAASARSARARSYSEVEQECTEDEEQESSQSVLKIPEKNPPKKKKKQPVVVPPPPAVNPWGVQEKKSSKTSAAKKEADIHAMIEMQEAVFAKLQLDTPNKIERFLTSEDSGLAELLGDARVPVSPSVTEQSTQESSTRPQDWKVIGSSVASGWGAVEAVLPLDSPSKLWETPAATTTSTSTYFSTSDAVSETSESSFASRMNKSSEPFYPVSESNLWLRDWLEGEAGLRGNTLNVVYEAFLEEQMDSKLGMEYLSDMTLPEFKVELADMNITKKGVVSKLRGAVKRLFA